jgi:hypothetical protein
MNYDIENVDILVDNATFYLENGTESTITDMYHNVRAIRLELEKFPLTESFPDVSISERIDYLIEKLKET